MTDLPSGSYELTQIFERNNAELLRHSLTFKKNGSPKGGNITVVNNSDGSSSNGATELAGTGMTDKFILSTDGWSDDFTAESDLT
jgi:hypothetical protein